EKFPAVEIDDHGVWLADFQALISSTEWAAYGVLTVILLITAVILVMSSRTELALHSSTVELLRSLGAERGYIARQFQMNALWMSLRGAVVRILAAMALL